VVAIVNAFGPLSLMIPTGPSPRAVAIAAMVSVSKAVMRFF
jgi:hypothetical protein